MQDLSVIQKLNTQAAAAEVPKLRAAGKFVVARYNGLSFVTCEGFDTLTAAHQHVANLATQTRNTGEHAEVLPPTVHALPHLAQALAD